MPFNDKFNKGRNSGEGRPTPREGLAGSPSFPGPEEPLREEIMMVLRYCGAFRHMHTVMIHKSPIMRGKIVTLKNSTKKDKGMV